MHSAVATATTLLWILIEAIQFGYMAYLIWREKNNDYNRYNQRIRSLIASV
jgi:hypothetical protein